MTRYAKPIGYRLPLSAMKLPANTDLKWAVETAEPDGSLTFADPHATEGDAVADLVARQCWYTVRGQTPPPMRVVPVWQYADIPM